MEIKLHLKQDANKTNKHLESSFTYVLKKRGEKTDACSSLEWILVRETRANVIFTQMFTWNKKGTFTMIKMQLPPTNKLSLSLAREAHTVRNTSAFMVAVAQKDCVNKVSSGWEEMVKMA